MSRVLVDVSLFALWVVKSGRIQDSRICFRMQTANQIALVALVDPVERIRRPEMA